MNRDVELSRQRVVRRRAESQGETVSLDRLLAADLPAAVEAPPLSAERRAELLAMLDSQPALALTPDVIDGPYWFDVDIVRHDLREDRPGLPLAVAVRVVDAGALDAQGRATPVPGAVVELWHCDAGGVYSGFEETSREGQPIPKDERGIPLGPPPAGDAGPSHGAYSVGEAESRTTDDGTYLRGAQPTDEDGLARFTTIYPGWYVSRSVHIHVKVHLGTENVLTAQLFFDDALNDRVFSTVAPYTDHTGRDTRNDGDFLYSRACQFLASWAEEPGEGVRAAINLVVDRAHERAPAERGILFHPR